MIADTRKCETSIKPWVKTSIYADGRASLAGIISAGVYAEGHFLDTSLTLAAKTENGNSNISLTGSFKPFVMDIGLVYTKISCSLSNLKKR